MLKSVLSLGIMGDNQAAFTAEIDGNQKQALPSMMMSHIVKHAKEQIEKIDYVVQNCIVTVPASWNKYNSFGLKG